jgi:type I restriction enzyme R subunit
VDRIELENQAKKAFDRNLKPDMTTVIYKQERDDWRKAEIVVSTVQSLQFNDKYRQLFSPTDFDLVISDEAHRSIGGNSRAVFEYFVGYKLGLTATPRDYLKHIDPAKLNDRDPRAWERRQLMDTYTTFGCESGVPTFRYSLVDGVRDKFLLNPIVVDARTDVTTELLSEKGYAVMVEGEDGELVEKAFASDDFEKKFFSDETNRVFCQAFLDHALRDPLSGEIGKSIIFCVRQKHALRIAQMLNEMAHERFPGRYQSDFAMQVTSNVDLAQQMAISFANNNLGGQTRWLDDYISARTRACVTVGMMTTGYDCEDLLNIVLLRPVFSPTDFIQIKGRGTRKYTFRHSVREGGQVEEHTAEKEAFKLFDFFANYEYFEEEYDYGQVQKLPLVRAGTPSPTPGPEPMPPVIDTYTYGGPDAPKTFSETPISPFGMKVDRMYFDRFSEQVKAQPQVRERYQRGDMQGAEEAVIANLFNKPEDFFDLTKLRKALQLDRRVTLAEILAHAFGDTPKIKTRAELVDDEVSKFVSIQKPDAAYVPVIRQFFGAYLTDEHIRGIIESGAYSKLADNPKLSQDDLRALGPWLKRIPEYVKDYVPLNTFMG